MKRYLVGSTFGSLALSLRNWAALKRLSFQNPEQASMIANAVIADRLIAHLPKSGSRFLDIGAHVGSIFSSVHAADTSVEIFAIEADPAKAAFLTDKFPYCHINNCAVGPEKGQACLYLHEKSGFNSLVDQHRLGGKTINVDVNPLDDLFPGPSMTFDTIKIDIEGAELGALRGGSSLIDRSRPTIMFESTSIEENALGYSARELWVWFQDAMFQVYTPDRLAHDAPPLSLESFLDAHHYPFRALNFFAVPTERRREIRDRARRILKV